MRMEKVTKEYDVYQFNELGEVARKRAIESAISFYMESVPYEEMSTTMQQACDKADDMRTPWFTGSYIWDYCEDEIIESCEGYEYTEDGSIFNRC
jgi:hypothetical protein